MHHLILLIPLLSIASGSPLAAGGDKPQRTPEEIFAKLDADADGSITKEEFLGKRSGKKAERRTKAFPKMDTNADGALDLAELTAGIEHHRSSE